MKEKHLGCQLPAVEAAMWAVCCYQACLNHAIIEPTAPNRLTYIETKVKVNVINGVYIGDKQGTFKGAFTIAM